jgi:HD-like signal output (HDOD) protein
LAENSQQLLFNEAVAAGRICLVEKDPEIAQQLQAALGHDIAVRVTRFEQASAATRFLETVGADLVIAGQPEDEIPVATFLRGVQQRHAEMVRVVVSDEASDPMDVLRRFPYAHQYLKRPLELSGLRARVLECLSLRQILGQRSLRALVSSSNALPAAPALYSQLVERLCDPHCPMRKVAEVIEKDTAMSTRLIQLVSSGFFGLSSPMTSIGACVAYLGLNPIRSLVLSAEISRMYPLQVPGLSAQKLQSRALGAARLARRLCDGTPNEFPAFLSGLFHTVGQLIIGSRDPARFSEALAQSQSRRLPLCEALSQVVGATDGEVAAYLLGLWGQPLAVVRAIAGQDAPERIDTHVSGLASLIYVSKRLSLNPDAPLSDAPTRDSDTLNEAYLSKVGLLSQVPHFRDLARRLAA